ncbi:MAG: TonB-dependent receptor plug domain-containing protein [Flavobacteriaceae bacterium]
MIKPKSVVLVLATFTGLASGALAQNLNDSSKQNDSLMTKRDSLSTVHLTTKILSKGTTSSDRIISIDQQVLKSFAGQSLASVLNQIGGIEVNGATGHPGQNLGLYVRGGNNRQVLVMIDGAVVNDPSSIATDFDLRLLAINQIESIDVIKGPSSVLYGSGAATAVIYIKTKAHKDQGISVNLEQVLGTNRGPNDDPLSGISRHSMLRVAAREGAWVFQAQASGRFTDGLSAVAAQDGEAALNPDEFSQTNGRFLIKYKPSEKWSMEQFVAYDFIRQDYDRFDYSDATFQSTSTLWRTGGSFYYNGRSSKYEFHDQWSQIERVINSDFPAVYKGLNYNADQFITTKWSDQLGTVIGTQGGWSAMDLAQAFGPDLPLSTSLRPEDSRVYFLDPYLNTQWNWKEQWQIDAGLRWHHHQTYGNQLVYQLGGSYAWKSAQSQWQIFAKHGTSFIAPSLYQQFDPIYGNTDLLPEFNRTNEFGVEWRFSDQKISIQYFDRLEEQAVSFLLIDPEQFVYQYANKESLQKRRGLEADVILKMSQQANLTGHYTYIHSPDDDLLRIPPHKFNINANYTLSTEESIGIRWTWSDARMDQFFNANTFETESVSLPSYHWLEGVYQCQLSPNMSGVLAITNLLNQSAIPIYGYASQGRNVRLSLRWDF